MNSVLGFQCRPLLPVSSFPIISAYDIEEIRDAPIQFYGAPRPSEIDSNPLDSFSILRSRNLEEIRAALFRFNGSRLDLPHRAADFDLKVNYWHSKNIGLSYWVSGGPVQLEAPDTSFFRQQIFLRGGADIKFGRIERQVTNEDTCVVPPEVSVNVDISSGSEQFVFRIEADVLLNKLAALIGRAPSQKLVFAQTSRANNQASGHLRRMLMFFAAELDALGSKMPSLVLAELEQALIVSFICNNPNNYSAFLDDRTLPAASWQVRRAEEYIEANWNQPITIEELARVTSASARSLFHQFKRSRGQSPMAFVKQVRLRRARDMLGRTDFSPSVTETALACGFTNLGHFARDYFKRFGERPSATIKRGKGDLAPSH